MIEPRILSRLVYFAAVVETQSFTRAAARLGITKSVVSQQVARLEEELGTGLLVRTTRRVEATEAGRVLYERALVVLRDAGEAVAEATRSTNQPLGTLRLLAPADYGTLMIVPVIAAFLRRYPECRADLRFADRIVDILAGEVDLSIRLGWLADSSLHAKRLGTFEQVLVGAPTLGSGLGGLCSPHELSGLPLIANMALPEPAVWHFKHMSGDEIRFAADAGLTIDTTRGVHAAALSGAGICILPDFVVADDVAAGRLVPVLPEWRLPAGGIHVVFPSARFRPARVAAFVDMLAAAIKARTTG